MKPIVCFVITKVELVVSFRVRHHSSPSNISMTAKKLPSLPSSVVSKTCSTLAQCLRQLFERSALSKRPYPTPVVLGDRQDSIGRETDPSQLSQPAGMPMPNRQAWPCPIARPCRMPPPSFSTDGSWALTKETDQDAAKRCHK